MRHLQRQRVLFFVIAVLACISWVGGCNAILGNESAVFSPDGAAASSSGGSSGSLDGSLDGTSSSSGNPTDGAIPEGSNPDAGPCVDVVSNPRHCGVCFHDCLAGTCADGGCQPFTVAQDPGSLTALAVSPTHVYWTNDTSGDVMRAPIAGGTPASTVFDGDPDGGRGIDIALLDNFVYFPADSRALDSSIARCPVDGCGGMAPEVAVAHVDVPTSVANIGGAIVFTEGMFDGRVGRCATPPCTTSFEVLSMNERDPTHVAGTANAIAWGTVIPPPPAGSFPEVRVKVGADDPKPLTTAFGLSTVDVVGSEVVYATHNGVLHAVSVSTGAPPRALTTDTTQTDCMKAEANFIYFTDHGTTNDGLVLRIDVASVSMQPTVLAAKQKKPNAIVTDATSVYWINQDDSTVMRLAK